MSGRCVGVNSVDRIFQWKTKQVSLGFSETRESSLCTCTLTGAKSIALEEIQMKETGIPYFFEYE